MNLPDVLVDQENIALYIPQKAPIVMVDRLLVNNEHVTISGFSIREDNIFVEKGILREPGLIENIAQTAALRAGHYYKDVKREKPPIGYIGAIKNLIINELPKINDELTTEITIDAEIFGATLISAVVKCNEKVMGSCEMKIFIIDLPSKL